jgi:hypothetical protein
MEQREIGNMESSGRVERTALRDLEDQVARQKLYIQTLLRLLLEKGVIRRDEFGEWLDYVDSLDGRADGKLGKDARSKSCSRCRRVSPVQARRCQYCDTEFPSAHFLAHEDF